MITQFTEVLIDNLASDSVWTYFSSCLSTKMIVTCSGLTKQVSHLLLSSLASSPLLAEKVKDKQQAKLVSLLVKFCLSDTTLEARNMGLSSPPSPSLLLDQFKNIWGQEAFSGGRVVGRGEFYLLYGSKDTSEEDVERWVQTCWLLEVTEKLVGQQKGKEEDWLLLARPMFVLLCKVLDREVEKGSYKLSLLLSVLLQLLSLVPDSKLWQLMTGQLDPELVVHCIRTTAPAVTPDRQPCRCWPGAPCPTLTSFYRTASLSSPSWGPTYSRLTPSTVSRLYVRHWR